MITQLLNYFGWPGVFNLNVQTGKQTHLMSVHTRLSMVSVTRPQ